MTVFATFSQAGRPALALAFALAVGAPGTAGAQQPAAAPATAAAIAATERRQPLVPVFAADPALLRSFGGVDGVQRLTDDFVERMRADARIGHHFDNVRLPELKRQLAGHLCQVLAGPCVYEGDSMKAAHAGLKITKADSLAQVELLQASMDALGIPFRDQNRLLARLAPMYQDIITR